MPRSLQRVDVIHHHDPDRFQLWKNAILGSDVLASTTPSVSRLMADLGLYSMLPYKSCVARDGHGLVHCGASAS